MNSRRNELLRLITEHYIKTAKPVSSNSICDILACSSATVRNEMSILEDLGYLEKEHISSGRIPSEKGYRYYVDNLMVPKEMTGEDILKLQTILNNNSLVLSDAITESLKIISDITDYVSVSLGNNSSLNNLKQIELIPLSQTNFVVILITDKGYVENKKLLIKEEISLDETKKIVEIINKMLVGTPIDKISERLEFEIKPVINKYVKQHEILYDAFYNVFKDFMSSGNMFFAGKNNILKLPEFNNIDKVRNIFEKFENKDLINNINEYVENDDEFKIYIGEENKIDNEVALIKTNISIDGIDTTIAIVGPKRMEYDRVVAILEYLKNNIESK